MFDRVLNTTVTTFIYYAVREIDKSNYLEVLSQKTCSSEKYDEIYRKAPVLKYIFKSKHTTLLKGLHVARFPTFYHIFQNSYYIERLRAAATDR